jgi:poly(3-hydroxybutyrate) depolymerase
MRAVAVVSTLAVLVAAQIAAADWQQDLHDLIRADDGAEREEMMKRVVGARPDWQEVARVLRSIEYGPTEDTGRTVLTQTVCADSVERPWVFRVPASYDPLVATPLLVVLHGGASYPDITEDPVGYADESELGSMAVENGWIAAFPFAQVEATWWDEVGMANIRAIVRATKRRYNVDDDRVWMAGFSDGASAGFLHAMVAPDDFAAFVALNGHMGVGSLDGDLPTYAPNMASSPIYATTTFDDGLYPSSKMRSSIAMARAAGADIFYHEMPGEHDFDDVAGELPAIGRFLERHPRDPFPSRISWEAGSPDFGRCRWFAIDRITAVDPANWHDDHNVALVDDRVTVGFQPDYDFEGPGIRVASLSDGDYPARSIGLAAGDVIIEAGSVRTDSLPNLNEWKATVERGDPFTMRVLREGEELILSGELPDPSAYLIFKRDVPSAQAHVDYAANRIDVRTSRVGAFTVSVHPDMIALDQNLVISVDGQVVHDAPVAPDVEYMIRSFVENRDRRLLYVAEIAVELP